MLLIESLRLTVGYSFAFLLLLKNKNNAIIAATGKRINHNIDSGIMSQYLYFSLGCSNPNV